MKLNRSELLANEEQFVPEPNKKHIRNIKERIES